MDLYEYQGKQLFSRFGIPVSDGQVVDTAEAAQGIPAARGIREFAVPIVVRLDGTSDEEGRKLLADANPPGVYVERTMIDAARRAVELAGAAA